MYPCEMAQNHKMGFLSYFLDVNNVCPSKEWSPLDRVDDTSMPEEIGKEAHFMILRQSRKDTSLLSTNSPVWWHP